MRRITMLGSGGGSKGGPFGADPSRRARALFALIDEARSLPARLHAAGQETHSREGLPAGQRDVLLDLRRHGPRTVPQLARARSVSRQHVQVLVNRLLGSGHLDRRPNPAHRRSPLFHLTESGERFVAELSLREAARLDDLELDLTEGEIEAAVHALRALRRGFDQRRGTGVAREDAGAR